MKVGEAILNSYLEISQLAEDMVAKCNGLPLALITVGGTMASRNDRNEWVSGLNVLRNIQSQFQGMDSVLELLKLSYVKIVEYYPWAMSLVSCIVVYFQNAMISGKNLLNTG